MAKITSQGLRKQSRVAVLRALCRFDVATRRELAGHASLSFATVSTAVNELIKAGVVELVSVESNGVARPISRLQIEPEGGRLIGVDVVGTHVEAAVSERRVTPDETIVGGHDEHEKSPEYVVAGSPQAVHGTLEEAGIPISSVVGVGVPSRPMLPS